MIKHIPVIHEGWPVSIEVKARYRTIYIQRTICEQHELDKMDMFYLTGNMRQDETYRKLRREIRKAFPKKYGCRHKLRFVEETATDYRWDTQTNAAVPIPQEQQS